MKRNKIISEVGGWKGRDNQPEGSWKQVVVTLLRSWRIISRVLLLTNAVIGSWISMSLSVSSHPSSWLWIMDPKSKPPNIFES